MHFYLVVLVKCTFDKILEFFNLARIFTRSVFVFLQFINSGSVSFLFIRFLEILHKSSGTSQLFIFC